MKGKLFFFFIFYLLFSPAIANISSNCLSISEDHVIEKISPFKIKSVEVKSKNYKKWTKNSLRILLESTRVTSDKYKKRFKANVIVKYSSGLQCKFTARIRHSGDLKDHILLFKNSIIQSLDVHLDSGNINGITKFKLFLTQTKPNFEDEVFMPLVLKELNFISPRTSFIKAKINGVVAQVLFQEKASKELLEFNNRREGPILEGQEKYMWEEVKKVPRNNLSDIDMGVGPMLNKGIKGQLTKQINVNWNNKGKVFSYISHKAISNLNLAYLLYINSFPNKKINSNFNTYNLNNELLALNNEENILKLEIYNLLMFATNGTHGLAPYNRKFYWNALENYFEPINYDSGYNIDGNENYFYLPFNNQTLNAFESLDALLTKLDVEKLKKKLEYNGLNFSKKKIKDKIKKIRSNLADRKNDYDKIDSNTLDLTRKYNLTAEMWKNYITNLKKIDQNIYLVYNEKSKKLSTEDILLNKSIFYECKISNLNCKKIFLSKKNQNKLLEGNLSIGNRNYQYMGEEYKTNLTSNFVDLEKFMLNDTSFYFEKGINYNFDTTKNVLDIFQLRHGAKAFLYQGLLKNITINFHAFKSDFNNHDSFSTINENNLTGCFSLLNLNVQDIKIKVDGSSCEDSVNLINVNGYIESVDISNSYKDGIDIDFSRVEIGNIKITKSKNDCVDLSAGEYKLNKLVLSDCGDKAISIGEKSFLTANDINVRNSNIGIASKDSSITNLKNVYLSNLKTCVSAYNKKQEFSGGILKIKSLECENYNKKIDKDNISKIIIENEL